MFHVSSCSPHDGAYLDRVGSFERHSEVVFHVLSPDPSTGAFFVEMTNSRLGG
jgi:hypothetical protein